MIGNVFLKMIHIGWVIGSIYICFFQEIALSNSIFTRIFMWLLIGGFATYYLFRDISSGYFFSPEYWSEGLDDDDFGDSGE